MPKPKDWLYFSLADLEAAQLLLKGDEIVLGPVFYHTQQCAEKALKAYLAHRRQKPHKTHDLAFLISQCIILDEDFRKIFEFVIELNPFSHVTRYPDDCYTIPTVEAAQDCIRKAALILTFVQDKIEGNL